MGVKFIIEIVDPNKYLKKASALLREEEKTVQKEGVEIGVGQFMDSFIKLEISIREVYEQLSTRPTISMGRNSGDSLCNSIEINILSRKRRSKPARCSE